jgi:hypothetical protein
MALPAPVFGGPRNRRAELCELVHVLRGEEEGGRRCTHMLVQFDHGGSLSHTIDTLTIWVHNYIYSM